LLKESISIIFGGFILQSKEAITVIFGGSSGIGASLTLGLAEYGHTVVPVSRTKVKIDKIVQELDKRGLNHLGGITADVTKQNEIESVLKTVLDNFGQVNNLINSAGAFVKKETVSITEDEWEEVINVNLKGTFLTCQIIGKNMIKKGIGGSIINIASLGAHRGLLETSPYCASKGGVLLLTKSLAVEWAKYNIRVNCISPGVFKTPLNKQALAIPERRDRIISRTPMGRIGQTSELVGATIFLTSNDLSAFVTGITIPVDGGYLAWGI
jgi:gluconate 5-dehydrogenase/2-deoxy-D-gluconate 3-dehydrogenase